MTKDVLLPAGLLNETLHGRIDRFPLIDMTDAIKGSVAEVACPIDVLVENSDVARLDVLLERATGRGDQDVGAAKLLDQGPEVCSVVDLRGAHIVALAVPREDEDGHALDLARDGL